VLVTGYLAVPAYGTVLFTASGLSSANVPVTFEAQLTISGNTLTVQLTNNSPVDSLNPNDLLGSFYFDILDNTNTRPTLTYASAVGDVYLADKNNPDTLQTANANLQAFNAGDNTWQYKAMNASLTPFLGFGIGTVGNSSAAPNNFSGNIVGAIDYSIYRGEITTANLDGKLLVKGTATFTFTGVSGYSEADIVDSYAFGLGTAPDSFLTPEPSSVLLFGLGMLGVAMAGRLKFSPRP
jgi:hypothetical protein